MICNKCGRKMKNVLHFELDREYQFNTCTKCRDSTKKKRIHYEDIVKTNNEQYIINTKE